MIQVSSNSNNSGDSLAFLMMGKSPEDVEEAAETEETAKYAFIARKKKCLPSRLPC